LAIYDEAALAPILIQKGQYAEARTRLNTVLTNLENTFGPDSVQPRLRGHPGRR
jgi:hypothetical protein